jgi:hypothetical protein
MKIFVDREDIYNAQTLMARHDAGRATEETYNATAILAKILKENPINEPDIPHISHEVAVTSITQEWENRQAILEILDMLGEYANDGNAGPGQPVLPRRDLHMRDKCYKLQRKLTGKKQ